LVAVVEVVEQEMEDHTPMQAAAEVLVHIEQTQRLFLDHKQYLFKLVAVEQEHMQHQTVVKE
jgi:hypothetical protein